MRQRVYLKRMCRLSDSDLLLLSLSLCLLLTPAPLLLQHCFRTPASKRSALALISESYRRPRLGKSSLRNFPVPTSVSDYSYLTFSAPLFRKHAIIYAGVAGPVLLVRGCGIICIIYMKHGFCFAYPGVFFSALCNSAPKVSTISRKRLCKRITYYNR